MSQPRPLTDYGVQVEADTHREQCKAFDDNGDRCPYVRESGSDFCSGCSAEEALLTLPDISHDSRNERSLYMPSSVRDILRDSYNFPPKDAVILASGSALSTCYVLEGRLDWAAAGQEDAFSVCGHTYCVERAVELLDQVREHVSSQTFTDKWAEACFYVYSGGSRCAHRRKTSAACGFHADRSDEDTVRVDRVLDGDIWGPYPASHGGEQQ